MRNHRKAARTPNAKMRNIRLSAKEYFEWSYATRESTGRHEVLKVGSRQSRLTPIGHGELSGDEHGVDLALNRPHVSFDSPILHLYLPSLMIKPRHLPAHLFLSPQ